MAWLHRVKVRHLFTQQEDHAAIQASMTAIADVLKNSPAFALFTEIERFYNIPAGDEIFKPVDYANRLLEYMYDYADQHRIWIE